MQKLVKAALVALAVTAPGCKERASDQPPREAAESARDKPGPAQVDEPEERAAKEPEKADAPVGWRTLRDGLDYRHLPRTPGGAAIDLHAFRVALAPLRLGGVDARKESRKNALVQAMASESNALLAVNGTFFDEKARPLGLLVSGGKTLSPLRKADWGVLEVREGRARIIHTKEYSDATGTPEFAIQCGPRVVVAGAVPKLKPAPPHRRTALCVAAPDSVMVMASEGAVTTEELGKLLALAESDGGFGCRDAMLLDGGPSTQLFAHAGDLDRLLPGWPVPNAVIVVPR